MLTTSRIDLGRRLFAEYLGSLLLAAIVIGSGIAAQAQSPQDVGLELFENAAATAAGLFVLILIFGSISGAHFNPIVSFVDAAFGGISWRHAGSYLVAQVAGCTTGAVVANLMFSQAAVSISTFHRASGAHALGEVVATSGLILLIFALARTGQSSKTPAAVGTYIGAAYFFTSSTGFANPAIAVGRMFSNSFAGIAPSSAPLFVGAEVVGGGLAFVLIKALFPGVDRDVAAQVLAPHPAPAREPDQAESSRTESAMSSRSPEILFLCVHNAGRSQMAAGFARERGGDRLFVHSAGSAPGESLNPAVVEAMGEKGIDISNESPRMLTDEMGQSADVIVTMGCGDACPIYPGKHYLDWDLTDPSDKDLDEVRRIRDEVEERVNHLVDELLGSTS